jgi:hypothetical protein
MRQEMERQSVVGNGLTTNHALIARHDVAYDGDDIENSVIDGIHGHCRPPGDRMRLDSMDADSSRLSLSKSGQDSSLYLVNGNWFEFQKPRN